MKYLLSTCIILTSLSLFSDTNKLRSALQILDGVDHLKNGTSDRGYQQPRRRRSVNYNSGMYIRNQSQNNRYDEHGNLLHPNTTQQVIIVRPTVNQDVYQQPVVQINIQDQHRTPSYTTVASGRSHSKRKTEIFNLHSGLGEATSIKLVATRRSVLINKVVVTFANGSHVELFNMHDKELSFDHSLEQSIQGVVRQIKVTVSRHGFSKGYYNIELAHD